MPNHGVKTVFLRTLLCWKPCSVSFITFPRTLLLFAIKLAISHSFLFCVAGFQFLLVFFCCNSTVLLRTLWSLYSGVGQLCVWSYSVFLSFAHARPGYSNAFVVSIASNVFIVMAVNRKAACYVMSIQQFLLDLLNVFLFSWPSPGAVTCVLFCLHVLSS